MGNDQIPGLPPGASIQPVGSDPVTGEVPQQAAPQLPPGAQIQPVGADPVTGKAPTPSEGFLSTLKNEVVGPTTAAGAPLNPDAQNEFSGVTDVFHGNFRQGFSKILAAETPHVVAGSFLEKAMKAIDPNFQGTPSSQIAAANDQTLQKPIVDAAQAIDKDKHPMLKAAAEAASSLTSPESVSILIGTGGLGLVDSPQALATANKLLSAGFTAQAVGSAYKNLKSFAEAYDKGDANDALYQLTHAVMSGTMSTLAGAHAAGVEVPVAGETSKAIAGKVIGAAKAVPEIIGEAVGKGEGPTKVETEAAKARVASDKAYEDFKKAAPPSARANYTRADYETARKYAELRHENVSPVDSVEAGRDTLDAQIEDHENKVSDALKVIPDEKIGTGILDDVKKELANHPDKTFAQRGLKELEGYNLDNPTVSEADKIRRTLNAENKAVLLKNKYDIATAEQVDPGFAARQTAVESLRNKLYDTGESYGIEGLRDLRREEGSMIKVRNALQNQFFNGEKVVRGSGNAGALNRIAGKAAKVVATGTGAAKGGPLGAVIGSEIGDQAAGLISPKDISKNELIERSFGQKVAKGKPIVPTVNLQRPPDVPPPVGTQSQMRVPGNISAPLFEQSAPTPVQPLEMSPEKLKAITDSHKADIDTLASPDATAVQKAAAQTRLNDFMKSAKTIGTTTPTANEPAPIKAQVADAAKKSGVAFRGIQEGVTPDKDVAIFEHPKYGSVAVKMSEWSPEKLEENIDKLEKRNEKLPEKMRTTPNASGESAASKEAINRQASEKARKVTRVRIDTRSGKESPLIGPEAVDMKAGPYDRIVLRQPGRSDMILDEGKNARPPKGGKSHLSGE